MTNSFYVFITFLILCGNITAGILPEPDSLLALSDTSRFMQTAVKPDTLFNAEKVAWHQMITRIPEDYYSFFKTSFSSKAVPVIAGFAALTGTLMLVDKPLSKWAHSMDERSGTYNTISGYMVHTGDGKYHFLLAGAFAVYGLSANDQRAVVTASSIAEGVLASGIMVQILKRITGRESPETSPEAPGQWRLFPNPKKYQKNQPKYYAFPSGHITTASLTVTVLANSYPEAKWIRPLGYALIGGLGLGLMSKNMHWISDLPLGILLGYTFGNIIAPEKKDTGSSNSPASEGRLSLVPFYAPSSYSLALVYTF